MQIPSDIIARFHAAGLLTSEPFPEQHVAFPDGVKIAKPETIEGNSVPSYRSYWGLDGPCLNAPSLILHRSGTQWVVSSLDWEPGPGPGDFVNTWDRVDEAVADIFDFFFGNPYRMSLK